MHKIPQASKWIQILSLSQILAIIVKLVLRMKRNGWFSSYIINVIQSYRDYMTRIESVRKPNNFINFERDTLTSCVVKDAILIAH